MLLPLLLAVLPVTAPDTLPHVIVFAPGDSAKLSETESDAGPAKNRRATLRARFQADLESPATFAKPLPLGEFPVYGRLVPGARGEIEFHPSFAGEFVTKVSLVGLLPNHRYILTLNGNPQRDGNASLPTPVPGNAAEHYFDFQTITTDKGGSYGGWFAVVLPTGSYDLRFYVKDTSDFKIVLYHDFFPFGID
ncbi:MAG TPA: hypothetical protein VHD32_09600 [Candidatus Didemnitutus sp.]|nr:hypothetical protein [Candidatus Didemnitutus sp.]